MKVTNITVDKNSVLPMRDILGINNIPRIATKQKFEQDAPAFEAMQFGHVRFHDCTYENPSQQIIDIRRIFPMFHLDEEKEENYFFQQTDDYVSFLIGTRAQIDFRLGETIDHSGFNRMIGVPQDIDKWARICRHIIGHYKNGEMHGMHLNIQRISIWEEPDNLHLFLGTVEQYSEMFCKVYKLIKKDFPDIQIGGPAVMGKDLEYVERFINICRENGVMPDFISSTVYSRSLEGFLSHVSELHEQAVRMGLADMKQIIPEWHYGVKNWKRMSDIEDNAFYTAESAAFHTNVMIALQDYVYVDAAYFYRWALGSFGLYTMNDPNGHVDTDYYGFLLYQKLAVECERRLRLCEDGDSGAAMLAGVSKEGNVRLLIACYGCEDCIFRVDAMGAAQASIRQVVEQFDPEECTQGREVLAKDGVFELRHVGGNGVYMLEILK